MSSTAEVNLAEREKALANSLAAHPEYLPWVHDGALQIAKITGVPRHDALIVLGSGLAGALDDWGSPAASFALSDLPGVKAPVADGHLDEVRSYQVGDRRVLVYLGRTHLYEGHGPQPVVHPVHIAALTGIERAILTNANGCLRDWQLGDVMAIRDHINLSFTSPFDGPIFFDTTGTWDAELTAQAAQFAQRTGVYMCLRGPEYQTLAESQMLQVLGADVVGMSTVMEALALHQLGVRLAGLSVVSDLSFAAAPTDPSAVVEAAAAAGKVISAALSKLVDF